MKSKIIFDNTITNMENAIKSYLKYDFENLDRTKIEELLVKFKEFPETLYKITTIIISNDKIDPQNKIEILDYIDANNSLSKIKIALNEALLLKRIELNNEIKDFDKIFNDYKKYALIVKINGKILIDLNNYNNKAEFLILYFRVLTKNHQFEDIIHIYTDHKYIEKYPFNNEQKNRFYNYLARAFSHSKIKKIKDSTIISFLDKADEITNSQSNIIRNFRYKTLVYWRLKPNNKYQSICIEAAIDGINYLNTIGESEIKKYKKYFSDLNRILAAIYIEIDIDVAKKYHKTSYDIIKDSANHQYEKFWLEYQICNIHRKLGEFKEAREKLDEINNNTTYRYIIENHPESKYKLFVEKCKLLLCENEIKNLKTLLKLEFKREYANYNIRYEFLRLVLTSEAFLKEENVQKAIEYFYTAKIINEDNKLNINTKRYNALKTHFQNDKR